ncbi:MAG: hypothetical protein EOP06_21390, partial [Proteobacteria bacterium]
MCKFLRQLPLAIVLLFTQGALAKRLPIQPKDAFVVKKSVTSSLASSKGTDSGGGGGVAVVSGQTVLLDFFQLDAIFTEPAIFHGGHTKVLEESVSSFSLTRSENNHAIERIPAFETALRILQSWESLNFDLTGGLVADALHHPVRWSFSDAIM